MRFAAVRMLFARSWWPAYERREMRVPGLMGVAVKVDRYLWVLCWQFHWNHAWRYEPTRVDAAP